MVGRRSLDPTQFYYDYKAGLSKRDRARIYKRIARRLDRHYANIIVSEYGKQVFSGEW